MASMTEHYAKHLAEIYVWMAGGAEAALSVGEADLREYRGDPALAVDLGAGFGMHAIPLAKAGFQVLAIDSSAHLLGELKAMSSGLAVDTQCDDLLQFAKYLPAQSKPRLIVCMGDTLTHLDSIATVQQLAQQVALHLATKGRFVATFRDYTKLPSAEARFIPVRSDNTRILTCFLEEHADHVQVHDIVNERRDDLWTTRVSSYPKLRLKPELVQSIFASAQLKTQLAPGPRGMLRLIADA